jgi:hypothetical protein
MMSSVLSMLDVSACAGSGSPPDHRAFLAANQGSAYRSDSAAHERTLGLAMVMSVGTPMRRAFGRRAQDHQTDRQ